MAGNLYPRPSTLQEKDGSGKLTFTDNIATGSRIAVVEAAQLFAAVKFLMGDVYISSTGNQVRLGADRWPGLERMMCLSVSLTPHGMMSNSDWDQGPYYEKAILDIAYGIPTWEEDDASDSPEDITFLTQSLDFNCEILTIPTKVRKSEGDASLGYIDSTRTIRLPTITYKMGLPKVKKPNWTAIQDACGRVNNAPLFGAPAEYVLFDGPHVDRTLSLLGSRAWKAEYMFIYNPHGWNNVYNDQTGQWVPRRDENGAVVKDYESADIGSLLRP